jgi:hypothetical protein
MGYYSEGEEKREDPEDRCMGSEEKKIFFWAVNAEAPEDGYFLGWVSRGSPLF